MSNEEYEEFTKRLEAELFDAMSDDVESVTLRGTV